MAASPLPVVIVGAGPVGLCLALYLAQHGVKACLIETLSEEKFLDQEPRAGSIHPATLEMLLDLGLYERMERRGLIAPTFQYWDRQRDEMFAEFDHAALKDDTRFPYVLQCERTKIIDEAMQMLKQMPACKIRMATTLKTFTQSEGRIDAVVANEAGEDEAVPGSFIVSAEGARSIVRKTLDIAFEGYTYPERTLTVSVCHDFDTHRGFAYRNYLSDPGQWSNLFKWVQPERWRVHFPTHIDDDPEVVLSDAYIQEQMQKFLPRSQPYEIVHRILYTVHQRAAMTFRAGRAILAGDSAHVNSPIGGMGMNSGIHDAVNLGEKLTAILRGESGLDVLDRYTRQRRHVAINHTQAQTERNKKLLAEKDPAVRQRNHEHLRRTAGDPKLSREFLLRTSLINSVREAAQIACLLVSALVLSVLSLDAVQAQAYPTHPVRIISPFAAGGTNDVIARIIGPKLAELLGQQFIIENRSGAGGVTGTDFGAKAAADGYTLTIVTGSTLAISAALRKLPYDPVRDFAPIGLIGATPYIVLVHPTVPVQTIGQLVALVKSKPGQVEFGSGGVGTPGHLAGEMLNTMTGIQMVHIPYKAGNLALNDLLGGHIALTISTTVTSTQLIKAGRLRALATTDSKRIPAFPDLPTVAESGVPGYEFVLWLGMAAPSKTPDAIIGQLAGALEKALQAAEVRERLATQSVEPLTGTPQDFADKIKRDLITYTKVVKDSGARAE